MSEELNDAGLPINMHDKAKYMRLRDEFAMVALQCLRNSVDKDGNTMLPKNVDTVKALAEYCYSIADEMMKARKG